MPKDKMSYTPASVGVIFYSIPQTDLFLFPYF